MQRVNYASITKRTISFTIDEIAISFLFIGVFYEAISSFKDPQALYIFLLDKVWVLMFLKILYHGIFIGVYGKTLGKYIVKIKAVDEESYQTIGLQRAFIRAVVRSAGEMLFYFTFIFAFFDSKRQTLHDKIVRCVVIDE